MRELAGDRAEAGVLRIGPLDGPAPGVSLRGELIYGTVDALDRHLRELQEDTGHIVLDVSAVTVCDSSGLAVLIGALRRAGRHGADVVLRGVGVPLRRVLDLTGTRQLFVVDATDERTEPA